MVGRAAKVNEINSAYRLPNECEKKIAKILLSIKSYPLFVKKSYIVY